MNTLVPPPSDPAPLFELCRYTFATELLTVAVAHFDVFGRLSGNAVDFDEFRRTLGLDERPAIVLLTALKAMSLLQESHGKIEPTETARRFLSPNSPHEIGAYIGLSRDHPGVLAMVDRLRTNRPAGAEEKDKGAAFIFREGIESAMELEESARSLTLRSPAERERCAGLGRARAARSRQGLARCRRRQRTLRDRLPPAFSKPPSDRLGSPRSSQSRSRIKRKTRGRRSA